MKPPMDSLDDVGIDRVAKMLLDAASSQSGRDPSQLTTHLVCGYASVVKFLHAKGLVGEYHEWISEQIVDLK